MSIWAALIHMPWLCAPLHPLSQFSRRPLSLKQPVSLPSLPTPPHRRCQGAAKKTKPWACSQLLCPSKTRWWREQLRDGGLVLPAISAWAAMSEKSMLFSKIFREIQMVVFNMLFCWNKSSRGKTCHFWGGISAQTVEGLQNSQRPVQGSGLGDWDNF